MTGMLAFRIRFVIFSISMIGCDVIVNTVQTFVGVSKATRSRESSIHTFLAFKTSDEIRVSDKHTHQNTIQQANGTVSPADHLHTYDNRPSALQGQFGQFAYLNQEIGFQYKLDCRQCSELCWLRCSCNSSLNIYLRTWQKCRGLVDPRICISLYTISYLALLI